MASGLIPNICLFLVLSAVDSCFIPSSFLVFVPETIPVGYLVTKVHVAGCDSTSLQISVTEPSFRVKNNGDVEAVAPVSVPWTGRTFSVRVQDNNGKSEMEVHLISSMTEKKHTGQGLLKRIKRKWGPPPFNILENDPGPYPKEIDKIISDSEAKFDVYYTMNGPGLNENPVGLFTFNTQTRILSVNGPVDREEFPKFVLRTRVFDKKTNKETDEPLDITIEIDDANDNAPQFSDPLQYTVPEHSNPGTIVGKVTATDRDQAGSDHAKVRYFLLSDTNLFFIHPETGVITTVTNTLDRETQEKHFVKVEIRDMDGRKEGLATTGTATITLTDINDNPPTFTKTSYTASVKENEKEILILRIPVEDKDLINTPNWKSSFVITKGNENGNFRMETDPKTNEGLLYVVKPLDYEKTRSVNLEVMARNEAELSSTKAQWQSVPVNVAVVDVDEGPEFTAPTVRFIVKENTPNGTLIGTYTAVDPETKSSNGIKYYKVTDPAAWINVDRNNGEIKVANTIDRESQFARNGTYNVIMKAVDATSKTGTGTIILQVEDVNDNVPEIPTSDLVVCEKAGELGSVDVVAEDKDQPPFSYPFSFSLPKDNDGKWSLKSLNDTSARLTLIKELPNGIYEVPIIITDLQGSGKTQTAKVRICQCRNGVCLAKQSSVSLGGLALLAMLLPLALLLLLCLLLCLFCVTKGDKIEIEDAGDGGILLKSNTEGKGEEVDPSLITLPSAAYGEKGSVLLNSGWPGVKSSSTLGAHSTQENGMYKTGADMQEFYSTQYDSQYGAQQFGGQFGGQLGNGMGLEGRNLFQDSAFLHTWQTNGRCLHQKLNYFGTEEEGRYADDIVHSYRFEGRGSAAGSVGCCSDYAEDDNLDFLNKLGPKFNKLADVCRKT